MSHELKALLGLIDGSGSRATADRWQVAGLSDANRQNIANAVAPYATSKVSSPSRVQMGTR